MTKKPLFKVSSKKVLILKVTHRSLNWITEQSGFDWLYDYEFKSPRVLTVESFLTNCDEPSEEFKTFCKRVKVTALREREGVETLIMFNPTKETP